MPITDSIKKAREKGVSDQEILQEIAKQNPGKKPDFDQALQKGLTPSQILNQLINEQNRTPAPNPNPVIPPMRDPATSGINRPQPIQPRPVPQTNQKSEEELRIEAARKRIEAIKKQVQQQQTTPPPRPIAPTPQPPATTLTPPKTNVPPVSNFEPIPDFPSKSSPTPAPAPSPMPPRTTNNVPIERKLTQIKNDIPLSNTQPITTMPLPPKPGMGDKLWVRFLIATLVLVFLAGVSTFWYWYLVIRNKPLTPPIVPTPIVSENPSVTPTPVQVNVSSPLFPVSETKILTIGPADDLPTLLHQTAQEWQNMGQFRRIVLVNGTTNKIYTLQDFFEALLIRMPDAFYQKLNPDFTLFVYGQQEGNRMGLAVSAIDSDGVQSILKSQESNSESNFEPFFDIMGKTNPAIISYFRNSTNLTGYIGPNFRFQTYTSQDMGFCYLTSPDYFVFSSSLQSMEKLITALGITGQKNELTKDLQFGSTGADVTLLQTWLKQNPVIYPQGTVNGIFGSLTKAAVIKFQETFAADILAPQGLLKGNGIVDSYTRNKLNELYSNTGIITPATELTTDLRYGDSGAEVKLLQTWLKNDQEVYPEGLISGWFGPATQRAVIKFQEKYATDILTPQGLQKGTGIVDSYTRKKLVDLFGK